MDILKKTRKRIDKIHPLIDKLIYELDDLRFATPKTVADWRAERLICNRIADLGCGIGFQAFSFAEKCKKVYAVEKDIRKLSYAKKNAEILGIKNIEFIYGDILDEQIIKKIGNVDVVFCDTERLPSETKREISTIKPDINKLLDFYSEKTDKIAIEVPPLIKKIPFDCEKEYISFDGNIRLTLYFNGLKTCERSAVILPGKNILKSSSPEIEIKTEGRTPQKYIYEIDKAVVLASLLNEFIKLVNNFSLFHKNKFCLFTSNELVKIPFIKNYFKVLYVCKNEFDEIIKNLINANAGDVILRAPVSPEKYWEERKRYEEKLAGDKRVHLFLFDKAIICEKMKFQ